MTLTIPNLRWFDLVVVLRTDNDLLHPRLEKRGYSQKKVALSTCGFCPTANTGMDLV